MRCRLGLNRRRILQSLSSLISTDNELLTYHQLGDILGLTDAYPYTLADVRTGESGREGLAGLPHRLRRNR